MVALISLTYIATFFLVIVVAPELCGIWLARAKRAYDRERSKYQ